ncbi:oligosaccharide flippase family protein [Priestia megaterium]|uniref:oligosaccharide flippase family protein n=1 Tax=Priestia megaterium TaxID=1404 RepID=UPI001BE69756|nr:oligosaccharide flippase family protein [Priestia megaterium]MBT2257843.1 oligosaccharide flippase family protein [Priestia megaterium]
MKDIIRNYSLNFGYQIIVLLIPFISIPYLSRVLGPNNLGVESFTTSLTSIFISIVNAGTIIYSTRQVAALKSKKELLVTEVYNIVLFRFLLGLISIIIFIFIILHSKYLNIFLVQLVFLIASTFLDCTWYFIGKENFKLVVLRNLVIKIVGLLLILQFVKNQNDLINYVWINAITVLIPNISLLIPLFKEIGKPKRVYFSFRRLTELIGDIYPFFIMGIITQVYMNIDKIIVERNNLIYELGVYSQFIKSYSVFLAPITAVGTILMPRITTLIADKKEDSNKIIFFSSNFIFILCIPISLGLLSISNEFVSLFYGKEFSEYLLLFQLGIILIFTGSLSNIVVQQVIYPNKLEKIYNFALTISSIFRIILIIAFINIVGIYGPLIAYIMSEFALMSISIYKTKKYIDIFKIIINFNNLKIVIAGIVMFFIINLVNQNLMSLKIIIGAVVYIFMLYILKENLSVKITNHITPFLKR